MVLYLMLIHLNIHGNMYEEKHYDWREVREMINEYKGQLVLDDVEIVNDF